MAFESDEVGYEFKSRIPKFSSDASIQEALKVYHYGVNDYTSQDIPDDSIEGNFRSLRDRILANETDIGSLGETYLEKVATSSSSNTIVPNTNSITPLTIKGEDNQTASLQSWRDSGDNLLSAVFSDGSASFQGYLSAGTNQKSTTISVNVEIADPTHTGVVVKSSGDQTANLQEWQDDAGTSLSWIDKDGRIFSDSITDLENAIETKFPLNLSTNEQTESYTLVLDDAQKVIEMNSDLANTLVIPPNADVTFPIGTSILVIQTGTGSTLIANGSGVTINSYIGLKIIGQWAGCTLIKRGTNSWVAIGGLVPGPLLT